MRLDIKEKGATAKVKQFSSRTKAVFSFNPWRLKWKTLFIEVKQLENTECNFTAAATLSVYVYRREQSTLVACFDSWMECWCTLLKLLIPTMYAFYLWCFYSRNVVFFCKYLINKIDFLLLRNVCRTNKYSRTHTAKWLKTNNKNSIRRGLKLFLTQPISFIIINSYSSLPFTF